MQEEQDYSQAVDNTVDKGTDTPTLEGMDDMTEMVRDHEQRQGERSEARQPLHEQLKEAAPTLFGGRIPQALKPDATIFLQPGIEDYLRERSGGKYTYAQKNLRHRSQLGEDLPPGAVQVDEWVVVPDIPQHDQPRMLITGSRTWPDKNIITAAMLQWWLNNERPQLTVVHGGAGGADRMAAEVVNTQKFAIEEHKADWQNLGRRAGFIRNQQMVNLGASVCLAFIHNSSRGATHCAGLALNAGIPTIIYRIDDAPDIAKRSLLR